MTHLYNDYDVNPDPPHQPLYLEKITKVLQEKSLAGIILDLGCGDGNFSESISRLGFDVIGIDASASAISKAQKRDGTYLIGSVYDDLSEQIGRKEVDAVISIEVIEHLYDPKLFIYQINKILKENGVLIITTPYWGYFKNILLAVTGRIDKALTVHWDGGHIKHFSRKSLTVMVENYGFKIKHFNGCGRRIPFIWNGMMLTFEKVTNIENFHRY
jgi:2-polyprenyl-3-methyl-5-hydroxy-6-metoxy-1,4-benzoquinol methylase